jgi:hypothetical protein
MDLRRQLRFKSDMQAKVTNLDCPGDPIVARLLDVSTYGVGLVLSSELPPGTAVKVEWGSTVLLGELIYCEPRGQEFVAGLEVEDAIYDSSELERIGERWA